MQKINLLRLISFIAVLMAACAPLADAPDAQLPLPSPSGAWRLKLTQSGGIAGVLLTVEVTSDGRLIAANPRAARTVTQDLSSADLAKLAELYSGTLVGTSRAPGSNCADCFNYRLEYSSGGRPVQIQADDTTLGASGASELIRFLQQLRDRALSAQP